MKKLKQFLADFILKVTKPIVQFLIDIEIPYSKKDISGKEYYYASNLIRPFDVILTTTHGELTNVLNVADFKHGAFYRGVVPLDIYDKKMVVPTVYEYTPLDNGHKEPLISTLTSCDVFAIYRLKRDLTENEINDLTTFMDNNINRLYDTDFSTENKSYYCFEYIAMAFKSIGINIRPQEILEHSYYDDKCFSENREFKLVFHSDKFSKLKHGDQNVRTI